MDKDLYPQPHEMDLNRKWASRIILIDDKPIFKQPIQYGIDNCDVRREEKKDAEMADRSTAVTGRERRRQSRRERLNSTDEQDKKEREDRMRETRRHRDKEREDREREQSRRDREDRERKSRRQNNQSPRPRPPRRQNNQSHRPRPPSDHSPPPSDKSAEKEQQPSLRRILKKQQQEESKLNIEDGKEESKLDGNDDNWDVESVGNVSVAFSVAASQAGTTISMIEFQRMIAKDPGESFAAKYYDVDPSSQTNHLTTTIELKPTPIKHPRQALIHDYAVCLDLQGIHNYMLQPNINFMPHPFAMTYANSHKVCWLHDQYFYHFAQRPWNGQLQLVNKESYWDTEVGGAVSVRGIYPSWKDYVIAAGNKHQPCMLSLDPIGNYDGQDEKCNNYKKVLKTCYEDGCRIVDESFPPLDHLSKHERIGLGCEVWTVAAFHATNVTIHGMQMLIGDDKQAIVMNQHESPIARAFSSKIVMYQECIVKCFVQGCARIYTEIFNLFVFFFLFVVFSQNFVNLGYRNGQKTKGRIWQIMRYVWMQKSTGMNGHQKCIVSKILHCHQHVVITKY
ncbi:MAG: hypothetical protein ACPG2Y_01745 [Acholeplasmataceae bacterium]